MDDAEPYRPGVWYRRGSVWLAVVVAVSAAMWWVGGTGPPMPP